MLFRSVFFLLFLAFLRWVPFVPLSEVKRLRYELAREESGAPRRLTDDAAAFASAARPATEEIVR